MSINGNSDQSSSSTDLLSTLKPGTALQGALKSFVKSLGEFQKDTGSHNLVLIRTHLGHYRALDGVLQPDSVEDDVLIKIYEQAAEQDEPTPCEEYSNIAVQFTLAAVLQNLMESSQAECDPRPPFAVFYRDSVGIQRTWQDVSLIPVRSDQETLMVFHRCLNFWLKSYPDLQLADRARFLIPNGV